MANQYFSINWEKTCKKTSLNLYRNMIDLSFKIIIFYCSRYSHYVLATWRLWNLDTAGHLCILRYKQFPLYPPHYMYILVRMYHTHATGLRLYANCLFFPRTMAQLVERPFPPLLLNSSRWIYTGTAENQRLPSEDELAIFSVLLRVGLIQT